MSRFATKSVSTVSTPDTTNLAGGEAFSQSPKLEFASALLTCFTTDNYYKSGDGQVSRIAELTRKLEDPLFAAKAAIFTRKKNGLRSVSHIVAGELALRLDVKGQEWTKNFFKKVIHRPDDITETLSYIKAGGNSNLRKLSNALKKGFGSALSGFDAYQLSKYRGEGNDINIFDAVNLLHPKSTPALDALMQGTLAPAETWETKLTQVGQKASKEGMTEADKTALKGAAWTDLLTAHKLGYLACLRNLRNIAEQAPDSLGLALALLTDPIQVQKSMILPFQIYTATQVLMGTKADCGMVAKALNQAMELSLVNVPKFSGETLLAVDTSGSMRGKPVQIAALMAAVLFKSQDRADILLFDTRVQHLSLNPADSLTTLTKSILEKVSGGGTDFHLIFEQAKKKYDRIVILSDMQAWVTRSLGYTCAGTPQEAFKQYKRKFSCDPRVYSFDLTGSGSLQFPESKVFALAGFSDAVLKVMQNLEVDPQALVHEIEATLI